MASALLGVTALLVAVLLGGCGAGAVGLVAIVIEPEVRLKIIKNLFQLLARNRRLLRHRVADEFLKARRCSGFGHCH